MFVPEWEGNVPRTTDHGDVAAVERRPLQICEAPTSWVRRKTCPLHACQLL